MSVAKVLLRIKPKPAQIWRQNISDVDMFLGTVYYMVARPPRRFPVECPKITNHLAIRSMSTKKDFGLLVQNEGRVSKSRHKL